MGDARRPLDTDAVVAPTMPTETADPVRRPDVPGPLPAAAARNAAPTRPVRDPRIRRTVIAAVVFVVLAVGVVLLARWLRTLEPVQEFVAVYPGAYELPEGAPVGLPAWLGWQHFFNVFLLVLIIRTGWQNRLEKQPTALWSSRRVTKRRMSLTTWLHLSLDVLWVVNGVIYVVLLFATGQWMRIVPTSWEVFPNAVSAGLQYASLMWPTENSWVSYNSLQQLTYFATVFVAAPLAIATGVRMSAFWPRQGRLATAYPFAWAKRVHFPVMLYLVAFIATHVVLVLSTGALRNLNHMYASRDVDDWVGFVVFAASLLVVAAGWIAAQRVIVVPLARRFGDVTER